MNDPIFPQFVNLIHQEKIREAERQIELIRTARERGEFPATPAPWRTWFAQAARWMKTMRFNRTPARQPEPLQEPCSVVPC